MTKKPPPPAGLPEAVTSDISAEMVRPARPMAFGQTLTRTRAVFIDGPLVLVPVPTNLTASERAPVAAASVLLASVIVARFGSVPANQPSVLFGVSKSQLPQNGSPLLTAEQVIGRLWTQVLEQVLPTQATLVVLGWVQSKQLPPQ